MVLNGVPKYGLVYGHSGTVHVVEGELDPIPPLVQVCSTYRHSSDHEATDLLLAQRRSQAASAFEVLT